MRVSLFTECFREAVKQMYGELARVISELVKQQFPEIASVYRYHAEAVVISVKRDEGVATIHPLRPDGSLDDGSPDIPDVPLPVVPNPYAPPYTYMVPYPGEKVLFCYLYHDPARPKIVECLGKGYIYGYTLWMDNTETHWKLRDGFIDIGDKGI